MALPAQGKSTTVPLVPPKKELRPVPQVSGSKKGEVIERTTAALEFPTKPILQHHSFKMGSQVTEEETTAPQQVPHNSIIVRLLIVS